jgi:hypothetical protein
MRSLAPIAALMILLAACSGSSSAEDASPAGGDVAPTAVVATAVAGDIAALAPSTTAAGRSATEETGPLDPGALPAAGPAGVSTGDTIVGPREGLATPTAATRNLWDAWREADRPRALMFASARAVDQLFQVSWTPQFAMGGCDAIEAGWACSFEGPTSRWSLVVEGDERLGYRVTGIGVVKVQRGPGEPLGEGRSTIVDPSQEIGFGRATTAPGIGSTDTSPPDGDDEASTVSTVSRGSSASTRAGRSRSTTTTSPAAATLDSTPATAATTAASPQRRRSTTVPAPPQAPPATAAPVEPTPAPLPVAAGDDPQVSSP